MPKVTVLLTSFNHAKYIHESIESILNQTFTDFELIIWDDKSTDDSWGIITSYSDPRIVSFRNEINKGPAYGVNKVISEIAKGEYLAIHHSDDIWDSEKLAKQVEFLDSNSDVGAVFTQVKVINEDGNDFTDQDHFYYDIFDQKNRSRFEWLRHFFVKGNCLCHPSILIRKSCYQKVGLYNPRFAQIPDLDMWVRLCMEYEIHILSEKLIQFRVRDNEQNASSNTAEKRIRIQFEYYSMLQNYQKFSSFEALLEVFPTAKIWQRNDGVDLDFVLAMVSLELKPYACIPLFALSILFEVSSNPNRDAAIKQLYDFDCKSFIALTGEHDAFSQEILNDVIAERDGQIAGLNDVIAERDGQIAGLNDVIAERDGQIAGLNDVIAERDGQIAGLNETILEYQESTSWKFTSPLRRISVMVKKIRHLISIFPQVIKKEGGIWKTGWFVLRVLRKEGLIGIKIRVRHFISLKKSEQHQVDLYVKDDELNKCSVYSIVPYYVSPAMEEVHDGDREVLSNTSIAVHWHLYYVDLLEGCIAHLNNIPCHFDLYVSVSKSSDIQMIREKLSQSIAQVQAVVVEEVPNRGRDVAPLIVQFGSRLKNYDIVGHFHTKKTPHKPALSEWSESILTKLLGAENHGRGRVSHFLNLLQSTVKIVFPEGQRYYLQSRNGWGENYGLAKYVLETHTHLSIDNFPVVRFSEGFMFWANTECIHSFLSLPLDYNDFPREPIAPDGTLAHALERLLLVFASQYKGQCMCIHESDSINDFRYYEEQNDYSEKIVHSDIKVLSYYLPQFHPIPENDLWHGKGFTEWTSVRAANPLFKGHYQQHIPHEDIGYYLIDSPDTLRIQADQMRKSGVHGQVFYHYWFSGKLILEEPAKMLLENSDILMPFCFCWANENWTKCWDGNENEILLDQDYSAQDAQDFIRYLIPFFKDSRYIKIEDRPVLFVYRPSSISDCQEYLDIWKNECMKAGIKPPYVVGVLTRGAINPHDFGMDAGTERVLHDWTAGAAPEIKDTLEQYVPMKGSVLSYDDVANFYMEQTEEKDFTYFRSIVPMWDNTARYGSEALLLHGSTPQLFQAWLESSIAYTQKTLSSDKQFLLVNAWNEWGEGAHLEPDSRFGYSYLNAIGRALSSTDYSSDLNAIGGISDKFKLHIMISSSLQKGVQQSKRLESMFLHCLKKSSILNRCKVSVNVLFFSNEIPNILYSDGNDADAFLNIKDTILFDSMVIEKLLETTLSSESAVIPNAYGNKPIIKITENGSLTSYDAYDSPVVVWLSKNNKEGFKNIRMRTDAYCFSFKPETNDDIPIVTTIIRFHKHAHLDELKQSLYCLLAMTNCIVIPYIAAQDLSKKQKEALEALLFGMPWNETYAPKVKYYESQDGHSDLRSLMLNQSLRDVATRYATFLDFDDLLFPFAYQWLFSRLQMTGKAVSFGRVYETKYNSSKKIILKRNRSYEYGYSYKDFLQNNHAPLHSFMLDVTKIEMANIVSYDDQRYLEDYFLTLQIFTEENVDWDSLKENMYIGDYICSIDRSHSLSIFDQTVRDDVLRSAEYILCDHRINEMKKKLINNV